MVSGAYFPKRVITLPLCILSLRFCGYPLFAVLQYNRGSLERGGVAGGTLVNSTGSPHNQVLFPNLTICPYMTFHEPVINSMPSLTLF